MKFWIIHDVSIVHFYQSFRTRNPSTLGTIQVNLFPLAQPTDFHHGTLKASIRCTK
jgi:hypothetical protein